MKLNGKCRIVLSCVFILCAISQADTTAEEIFADTSIKGGLVVHLGCGDGKLTAKLLAGDSYIVHGLDSRDENIKMAITNIRSQGVYGKVSISKLWQKRLPYAENMVNLLVSENPGDIALNEIMRVLTPGGVAYIKQNGKWQKTVKPRPDTIDEWTHRMYDATGNAVVKDSVVDSPRRLKWKTDPKWMRHHDLVPTAAMVSSGGRVFYIHSEGPIEAHAEELAGKRWYLYARDAFNGTLLWKKHMPKWGWNQWSERWLNRYNIPFQLPRRLVAAGDRVYVTLGYNAPLSAIDAATGKVIKTYQGAGFVDEILHIENRLVLSVYTTIAKAGFKAETVIKSVCSVDPAGGKVLWKTGDYKGVKSMHRWINPFTRLELCTTNGRVFLVDDDRLVALDLKTGNEIWTAPRPGKGKYFKPAIGNDMCTLVCYEDVVLLAQLDPENSNVHHFVPGSIYSFSAKDGKMLWKNENFGGAVYHSQPGVFVIDGLVWFHEHQWPDGVVGKKSRFVNSEDFDYKVFGADPVTGRIARTFDTKKVFNVGHHHRCHRNFATEKFLLTGRRGVELIDIKTGAIEVNHWLRGTCLFGYLPCNGMIYTPPHPCQCYQNVLLTGFNALEPLIPGVNDIKRMPDDKRLQKGPAYGRIKRTDTAPSGNDWPTYRHDGQRTASSNTTVNPRLKEAWDIQLKGKLTAPVSSGGKVFVASKDEQILYALNAENGGMIWSYTTDGIVDSPPTIYEGLVLFGTRNGWVYALAETDGKLVWRFLAAAEQRLIGVYGRLESAWPVFGSVLVSNGKLYCAAGRTSYLDGGIDAYELDPHTGQLLGRKHYYDIDPETGESPKTASQITPGVKNDILVACGDSVFLNHKRIVGEEKGTWEKSKAKPKKAKPGEKKNVKPTSRKSSLVYKGPIPDIHMIASGTFLDDSYFTRTAMSLGTSYGQLIAYDEMVAYGMQVYEAAGRNAHFFPGTSSVRLYSSNIAPLKAPWSPDSYMSLGRGTFDTNWSINISVRAKAMVLANETLFVCGQPDIFDSKDPFAAIDGKLGSVLIAVSTVNGDILAEHKIESIPVFDSLIAANNSLYMTTEDGKVHCYK